MAYRLAVFFMLSLCALGKSNPICPVPTQILPCTCKTVAYGLDVVCKNMNSGKELKEKFQVLAEYEVNNLYLHALTGEASKDIFQGMKVNALQVQESNIKFAGVAFDGLNESLKQLTIMNLNEPIQLANLAKLQEFQYKKNQMKTLKSDWLQSCIPNLRLLNLDNNDIATIEDRAFSHLSDLSEISLADNQIIKVQRNFFPSPAEKLTKIDLSYNKLGHLPKDIFSQMPNLQRVILSGNDLKSIPENTWSEIWSQVNAVLLFENSLVCDQNIDWIKKMKKPRLLEGTCVEPEDVEGKSLKIVLGN